MANKKGRINLNYYLKDKSSEYTLLYLVGYHRRRFKISTRQTVYVKSWDSVKQRCIISTAYHDRVNRIGRKVNKFLDNLDKNITEYFTKCPFHADDVSYFGTPEYLKKCILNVLDDMLEHERVENEKKIITPLQFFQSYVKNMPDRIDIRTGRYIAERTIRHHRTVLKRFQSFFGETHITDDFGVFDARFQTLFTNWAYKSRNYHYNTIPTSFSILKVWLNEAARQGLIKSDTYKSYPSKSVNVDNIYLTEEEITRIYSLDIPELICKGVIDAKSTIETTQDLFIIGCWTGLRQSDLNHLEKALFDVEAEKITVVAEKTNEKVVIPMHPYIRALYLKYKGAFPKMCYKSRFNEHLQELGRLAGINQEIIINENRGGKVRTIKYLKYQLIKSHTARRSFATNLYKKGAPTYSIMKLTGHTTEANFLKYIKVSKEENAQMMRKYFE